MLCAFTEFVPNVSIKRVLPPAAAVPQCLRFPLAWIGRSPARNSERIELIRDTDNPGAPGRWRLFATFSLQIVIICSQVLYPASGMRSPRALLIKFIPARECRNKTTPAFDLCDLQIYLTVDYVSSCTCRRLEVEVFNYLATIPRPFTSAPSNKLSAHAYVHAHDALRVTYVDTYNLAIIITSYTLYAFAEAPYCSMERDEHR